MKNAKTNSHKRLWAAVLLVCALLCAFTVFTAVTASAASDDTNYFYVNSETGDDHARGTSAGSAVKTFTRACNMAKMTDGATIVITNAYEMPKTVTEVEHDVPFVITTKDDEVDYAEKNGAKMIFATQLRYVLKGDTTFENITLEYGGSLVIVGNFNYLTIGDNVNLVETSGASNAKGVYIVGGYQSPMDNADPSLDAHVTVKSGKIYVVIASTRQKGSGQQGLTYTGTTYVNIEGGEIDQVHGGSNTYNICDSTNITVTGGKIRLIHTGGDATRRLEHDAVVTLAGGEVGTLNVNNVVGAADVYLTGGKLGATEVTYASTEIQKMARTANKQKVLHYDANYYSVSEIAALGAPFDVVENITSVFAKDGASGSGASDKDPTSFANAIDVVKDAGGNLVVMGKITLDNFTESAHTGKISVKGYDSTSAVTLGGTYTLGGETSFDEIKVTAEKIDAANGVIVFGKNAAVSGTPEITGNAKLYAGSFGKVSAAGNVLVDGATVSEIVGGVSAAKIEMISGSVGTIKSAETQIGAFDLSVSGGKIDKVIFKDIRSALSLLLYDGTVSAFEVAGDNVKGRLTMEESKFNLEMLGAAAQLFTVSSEKVFYLKDGGNGNGASAAAAGGSFEDAYAAIGNSNGTIVVCGPYTIPAAFLPNDHSGKITITSLYEDVDYRKTADASIIIKGNFYCGGDTEFDHIKLINQKSYGGILAKYKNLTIGSDVECTSQGSTTTYPSVIGGSGVKAENASGKVVVNGGAWQRVRLGNSAETATNCSMDFTINGGEVLEYICVSTNTVHTGDLTLTVNGGIVRGGLFGMIPASGAETSFTGNMTVNINGGVIYGQITPAKATGTILNGTYTVNIGGGEFAHVTDLLGTEGLVAGSAVSTLNVAQNIDLNEKESGVMTFTNPIRPGNVADPWVFYFDGYYYLIATGGKKLALYRASNIGDLYNVTGEVIYAPESGHEYSINLWSPEIHYFSEEEAGAGNAGWYCFLGSGGSDSDDKANFGGQRQYVIKCLDGNNLFGRWGNPVTGEVNVPRLVTFENGAYNVSELCGGSSKLNVGGKHYITFVSERGRGTPDFYQTINITTYANPWTMTGTPTTICVSEYEWEMHGSEDKIHPKVVEGTTAIYADDGSVFLLYTGSGYWTTWYAIGQMKYMGGDPLDKNSWQKMGTEPILQKSNEVNGCGHAASFIDTDGQRWLVYHGYKGNNTQSGRFAWVEPYTVDATNGVVIGNGTKKPASPSTVYTVNINPTPLAGKISGFGSTGSIAAVNKFPVKRVYLDTFTDVPATHWSYSYVANAYSIQLANGTSKTTFSPDSSFTVAQALTAAANVHTAYYNKTVPAAQNGEAWYVPYVNYCIENGIITAGQFADYNANIKRGDMAVVFANILPESEYAAKNDKTAPDVSSDMACAAAVQKLLRAGIVGGDAGTGNYRPNDSIKRSEACVIFTRIAMADKRA
ncbi:MAG: family 43 glycosylhydrolase [Clostridia bacterium]|nr:family 43 glycosylhydrolase [Clostridia bacterium]